MASSLSYGSYEEVEGQSQRQSRGLGSQEGFGQSEEEDEEDDDDEEENASRRHGPSVLSQVQLSEDEEDSEEFRSIGGDSDMDSDT